VDIFLFDRSELWALGKHWDAPYLMALGKLGYFVARLFGN
jgi:hypothetical protein